jgi:uncharacterized protein YndB with AHSA1/START domain
MGDIVHKKSIAAPPTAVFAALTEQHHPKSCLHPLFTS